jgi:alpha,alpha-trehalase
VFSAAAFYPFWSGIIPDEVANNEQSAFGAFASIHMVMSRYNGTFPVTFVESGLQWLAIYVSFNSFTAFLIISI